MCFVKPSALFSSTALAAVALIACQPAKNEASTKRASELGGPVTLERAPEGSDSAPQVTAEILVKGIKPNGSNTRLCYAAEASHTMSAGGQPVYATSCQTLVPNQTEATLAINNLATPTRIFVFHDENNNQKLDFSVFNALVVKREAIAEGYAFVEDPATTSDDLRIKRILMLPPGNTKIKATLSYQNTAFEEFLVEKAWEQILNRLRAISESQ
jgi:hypothetical protein